MNFIIQIDGTEKNGIKYDNSLNESIQKLGIKYDFIDLDNQSDTHLIELSIKGISLSNKTCLFFNLNQEINMALFIDLATYIIDNPINKLVFITGENKLLTKLLSKNRDFIFYDKNPQQQFLLLKSFFKN